MGRGCQAPLAESHVDLGCSGGPAGDRLPLRVTEQLWPERPAWSTAFLWHLCHHLDLCLFHRLPEDRVGRWWSPAPPELEQTQGRGSVLSNE